MIGISTIFTSTNILSYQSGRTPGIKIRKKIARPKPGLSDDTPMVVSPLQETYETKHSLFNFWTLRSAFRKLAAGAAVIARFARHTGSISNACKTNIDLVKTGAEFGTSTGEIGTYETKKG